MAIHVRGICCIDSVFIQSIEIHEPVVCRCQIRFNHTYNRACFKQSSLDIHVLSKFGIRICQFTPVNFNTGPTIEPNLC